MTELNLGLRALHLAGAILWIGGAVTVALVALRLSDAKSATALRDVARRVAMPGMILAFVGGLSLLAIGWSGYARAGWMHGKLLLVVIAAGLTGALSARLRKLAAGEDVKPQSIRMLAHGLLVLMALVLVLVLLGPIWMPAATAGLNS